MANSAAMVSAFVFNNCPFPSWVMAQNTGVISEFNNRLIFFAFIEITSPTHPKSISLTGLFTLKIDPASAPDIPIASQFRRCKLATIFLLIKPA